MNYLTPETFTRKILSKKTGIVNAEYLIFPTNTPKDFISKIIKNIFNVETKRFSMQKILIELNNIIKKSEEGANKLEAIENKGRKRK
uniref:Uncharacterized protein n=1 Tax=Meloidogyne enterolobii TaxID=390850 RepID=A0A6V7U7P0_MELEN|nr:unnamed protein product [Meloidogyne enterolobii]